MFKEQQLSVGGATLNFAVGPKNGPPLVLLHGITRRWQDFGPCLATLGSRWQIFAVDHRGHGKSSRAERYLVTDYVADAIAFVRGLDQPPIVVGHSLGALVALGVAAAMPVRGVVLEEPPSAGFLANLDNTPYSPLFKAMRDLAGSGRTLADVSRSLGDVRLPDGSRVGDYRNAAELRFLARCLADLDAAVLTPTLVPALERHWVADFDMLAAAASVKCPALLLVADLAQGGMLPPEDATTLAATCPDVVRLDFPGVGHLIHGTRPEQYLLGVMSFLDSL